MMFEIIRRKVIDHLDDDLRLLARRASIMPFIAILIFQQLRNKPKSTAGQSMTDDQFKDLSGQIREMHIRLNKLYDAVKIGKW